MYCPKTENWQLFLNSTSCEFWSKSVGFLLNLQQQHSGLQYYPSLFIFMTRPFASPFQRLSCNSKVSFLHIVCFMPHFLWGTFLVIIFVCSAKYNFEKGHFLLGPIISRNIALKPFPQARCRTGPFAQKLLFKN